MISPKSVKQWKQTNGSDQGQATFIIKQKCITIT